MSATFAWIGRVLRGRRLDHNPLRRRLDRIETILLAVLLAAFLGGAPVAAYVAATWTSAWSQRELQAQHLNFREITAVLLEAPVIVQTAYGYVLAPQANARWVAPDGEVHVGVIDVPADAKAGSTVRIWTSLSGQPVTLLQQDAIPLRADLAAAAAIAVLGIMLLGAAWGACRTLNRRRMAAWDADWLTTGPRWSSRR